MTRKYRKLFIIGNGFDRWQGLPTSYDSFKDYYRNNIRRIVKSLHIKAATDMDGNLFTPVEMVFGDISKPSSLPEEFFWNFESALAFLDDQKIINHFDKSNKGLYNLQETVDKAQKILQKAFGNWITFSEKDRIQAERVMKRAGCKKYVLYQGIEECIEDFKV